MYRQFENTIILCISTLSPRKTLLSSGGWKELRHDKNLSLSSASAVTRLFRQCWLKSTIIRLKGRAPIEGFTFHLHIFKTFWPTPFSSYDSSFDVNCFLSLLFWSQTWFILGPMNSFFRALCVEYEIYWRVISPDRQKFFAIRRPIFKLEYFNKH